MNKSRLLFFILLFSIVIPFAGNGQSNSFFQVSAGMECAAYSWYRNPDFIDSYKKSSGSLMYNPGGWLGFTAGTDVLGIAAHGKAIINFFNFDFGENKGLSAYNYGLIGSLYINRPHKVDGFSLMLSIGTQWNQTELWIKPRPYRSLHRPVFQTSFLQVALKVPLQPENYYFLRIGKGAGNSRTIEGGVLLLTNLLH